MGSWYLSPIMVLCCCPGITQVAFGHFKQIWAYKKCPNCGGLKSMERKASYNAITAFHQGTSRGRAQALRRQVYNLHDTFCANMLLPFAYANLKERQTFPSQPFLQVPKVFDTRHLPLDGHMVQWYHSSTILYFKSNRLSFCCLSVCLSPSCLLFAYPPVSVC